MLVCAQWGSVDSPADALQAAIDSLPPSGGEVRLAPGEWVMDRAIHLRSGLRLVGGGSRIVCSGITKLFIASGCKSLDLIGLDIDLKSDRNFAQAIYAEECSGISLTGCSIADSNVRALRETSYTDPSSGRAVSEWTVMALNTRRCKSIRIMDSRFSEVELSLGGPGVSGAPALLSDVLVRGCSFRSPLQYAVAAVSRGDNGLVSRVSIHDCSVSGDISGGAFYFGSDDAAAFPGTVCEDVSISSCRVRGKWGYATKPINCALAETTRRISIESCEIEGDERGQATTGIAFHRRSGTGLVDGLRIKKTKVSMVDRYAVEVVAGRRMDVDVQESDTRGLRLIEVA